MTPDIEIRPYRPGDETSILEGWNEIFPAQDDLPPRDERYWDWEFRRNTLARPEVVVAVADGRVVGQYASVPQRAVDEGEDITIGLVVDAFVLPAWRRAGERPGLIIHLARELHACYCGQEAKLSPEGHSLLYGYPFPIWRVARRYLDSEIVRDMDILFREVAVPGFVPNPVPGGVRLVEVTEAGALGDRLWAAVKSEVRFGLVRDSQWFEWRYARHPQRRYRFLVAEDAATGEPRGLAVYSHGRYAATEAGIVCDWLVPAADGAAEQALLSGLEEWTRADQVRVLLAVFSQVDPRFLSWQRRGFLVGPPSHFLVMNSFQHHVRWLRDRWLFTLGDSDLV